MSQMRAGLAGIVAGTEQVVLQMTAEGGATDEAFRMEAGRRFHDLAAAAGNERSPTVDPLCGRNGQQQGVG